MLYLLFVFALIVAQSVGASIGENDVMKLVASMPKYASLPGSSHAEHVYLFNCQHDAVYDVQVIRHDRFIHRNSSQSLIVTHDGITEKGTFQMKVTARQGSKLSVAVVSEGEGFSYTVKICEEQCDSRSRNVCNGHGGSGMLTRVCECDVGFRGPACATDSWSSSSSPSPAPTPSSSTLVNPGFDKRIVVVIVVVAVIIINVVVVIIVICLRIAVRRSHSFYIYQEETVTTCAELHPDSPCCVNYCSCCTVRTSRARIVRRPTEESLLPTAGSTDEPKPYQTPGSVTPTYSDSTPSGPSSVSTPPSYSTSISAEPSSTLATTAPKEQQTPVDDVYSLYPGL